MTKPKGATSLIVNLTTSGEQLLGDINGVQKEKKPDGTTRLQSSTGHADARLRRQGHHDQAASGRQ